MIGKPRVIAKRFKILAFLYVVLHGARGAYPGSATVVRYCLSTITSIYKFLVSRDLFMHMYNASTSF